MELPLKKEVNPSHNDLLNSEVLILPLIQNLLMLLEFLLKNKRKLNKI